jgi:hypothetical protein
MKKVRIVKVVLCGPGDVKRELELAREVIDDWNKQNFGTLNCGIESAHWSTDAVPSMTARGQQVINWQLIDEADLVVAVFWRRLGTPTGLYESGTAEEICRAQARGIHVMVYFSQIEDPRPIEDPEQWDRLQAFHAKALITGLPATFRSRKEFRERFATHLDKQVREILAKKKAAGKKRVNSVKQTQSGGTGNLQIAGDGNVVNLKSASTKRPRVVIERSPDHLTAAEQKAVFDWIEELSIMMENAQRRSTRAAKGELWSRLKNQFNVSKYEQIDSSKMPEVKAWYQGVKREIQNSARRKAPSIFRRGKIPGIKEAMHKMGRTNEEYYPEIAQRLRIRTFSSLNDLNPENLEKIYNLVRRDLRGR